MTLLYYISVFPFAAQPFWAVAKIRKNKAHRSTPYYKADKYLPAHSKEKVKREHIYHNAYPWVQHPQIVGEEHIVEVCPEPLEIGCDYNAKAARYKQKADCRPFVFFAQGFAHRFYAVGFAESHNRNRHKCRKCYADVHNAHIEVNHIYHMQFFTFVKNFADFAFYPKLHFKVKALFNHIGQKIVGNTHQILMTYADMVCGFVLLVLNIVKMSVLTYADNAPQQNGNKCAGEYKIVDKFFHNRSKTFYYI